MKNSEIIELITSIGVALTGLGSALTGVAKVIKATKKNHKKHLDQGSLNKVL